jgi:hypothetical protein
VLGVGFRARGTGLMGSYTCLVAVEAITGGDLRLNPGVPGSGFRDGCFGFWVLDNGFWVIYYGLWGSRL